MFVLNAYFCCGWKFVAILRSKLRFLLRSTGVDSDFTQNFWGKNWRLKSLLISFISLTAFFCSGVSSRTQSRSRQADSSTDMSLPDPRLFVASRRRCQPAQQPSPAPPPPQPPQPDQVPCNGNLILAHYSSNHQCSSPCNQTKIQISWVTNKHERLKIIKDKKAERQKMMNRAPKTSRRPLMDKSPPDPFY